VLNQSVLLEEPKRIFKNCDFLINIKMKFTNNWIFFFFQNVLLYATNCFQGITASLELSPLMTEVRHHSILWWDLASAWLRLSVLVTWMFWAPKQRDSPVFCGRGRCGTVLFLWLRLRMKIQAQRLLLEFSVPTTEEKKIIGGIFNFFLNLVFFLPGKN